MSKITQEDFSMMRSDLSWIRQGHRELGVLVGALERLVDVVEGLAGRVMVMEDRFEEKATEKNRAKEIDAFKEAW